MSSHLRDFLTIFAAFFGCLNAFEHTPVVQLVPGAVRGIVLEAEDYGKVNLYQGIRYGKASRFHKPKPADHWTGVYNATTFQFACPQGDYPVSDLIDRSRGLEAGTSNEDCLFLNVWTPAQEPKAGETRSVMIYFHGGSFESGTIFNAIYDSRYLAAQGDVIVITVNYRLGPFGFLFGGTEDAPGNAGLYDQILAICWVHENIQFFGGNPTKVTIFGQSAGAMSAGALILSPLAKGLFQRAILQSGSPNSYFGSTNKEQALTKAKVLGEKLKCSTTNMVEMLACLRSKSTQEILNHTKAAMLNGEAFVPTYGTEVIPLPPVQALKEDKFNHVDLMYGVVRDEGAGFITKLVPMLDPDSDGHEMTLQNVKTIIAFMYQMFQEPYYNEVAEFYAKHLNESDKLQLRRTVAYSFADYHLVCPTMFFGEQAAKQAPEKRFYSYRVTLPPAIGVMGCHGWMGVCHGSDVIYTFGIPQRMRGIVLTEAEYQLSHDMTHAWTSFAKNGNPGKVGHVEWTQALEHAHSYTKHMALDPNQYEMIPDYYRDVCNGFFKAKLFV